MIIGPICGSGMRDRHCGNMVPFRPADNSPSRRHSNTPNPTLPLSETLYSIQEKNARNILQDPQFYQPLIPIEGV